MSACVSLYDTHAEQINTLTKEELQVHLWSSFSHPSFPLSSSARAWQRVQVEVLNAYAASAEGNLRLVSRIHRF